MKPLFECMQDPGSMQGKPVRVTIPSHPQFVSVVRHSLFDVACIAGFDRSEAKKVVLAVDEACTNIIKYAYEMDTAREIYVTMTAEPGRVEVVLEDSGKMVDPSTIRSRDLDDLRPGGLGVHFIRSIMDEVCYHPRPEGGTRLVLAKCCVPAADKEEG